MFLARGFAFPTAPHLPARTCWGHGPFGGAAAGRWFPGRGLQPGQRALQGYSRPSPGCSPPAPCPGRWTFGDGEQAVGQFKPPYESFEVPDPTVAQVLVEHNTSHTYTFPGKGWPPALTACSSGALCPGTAPPCGVVPGSCLQNAAGLMAWAPTSVKGGEGGLGLRDPCCESASQKQTPSVPPVPLS